MLLESRLDEDTLLYIDTDVTGGFSKGDDEMGFHPDQILDNVVKVAAVVASRLAEAGAHSTERSGAAPSRLSLAFGIKVDGSSVVSVASDISSAHFQVTAEWAPQR